MSEQWNTIQDVFRDQSAKWSDHIFVEDVNTKMTYSEFYDRAHTLGQEIQGMLGRKLSGRPVAVFGEKSVRLLLMMFAVMESDAFYVVLNPEQPKERLNQILTVLEPELLIYADDHAERAAELEYQGKRAVYSADLRLSLVSSGNVEHTSKHGDRIAEDELLPLAEHDLTGADPLYGIFTSGSTGLPKCVLISHKNVIDFIGHFTEIFEFTEEDIIGNQAPFDFDVSVKDIYGALFSGAKLVLIPREYFSTPARLLDYMVERHVTNLTWAVSALCIISGMKGFDYKVPTELRQVMFSGEVMPIRQLNIWRKYLPQARYVNLYGPTEITCNCSYYVIDREFSEGESLPLGEVFPGRELLLLDAEGKPVSKPGLTGEICVRGESVGIGYYHNPEQTSAHFVEMTEDGITYRTYKTGDLAEIAEDGNLYFAGRKDFQIKHMGHRIELEEIEKNINSCEGVTRCVCAYDEEHHRLSAYYTGDVGKKALHLTLKEKLPIYMVPNRFYHVIEFILNKNGKIDRKSLSTLEVIE